jgi:hypothetical protein
MEPLVFKDKNQKPTEELIFNAIGDYSKYWDQLFHKLRLLFPDVEENWNYYNDGKSWLLKTVKKKKTLFWTAIFPGTFNVTFYFGDKASDLIDASSIADDLKDQYNNGKRYGKIRAITMKVLSEGDVENALKLAELKNRIK